MFTKPSIYYILGTPNAGERDPLKLLEEALKGGISHFQLREKGMNALTGQSLKEFALKCQALCRKYGVPFIINDDVELAHELNADGVHVGQEDAKASDVRARVGDRMMLGVSVHSVEEAAEAIQNGADYLGMGPIYGTKSKSDAKAPSGVSKIIQVRERFPEAPVIGIGGITADNAEAVWEAGAAGIAVISAITEAGNVQEEVQKMVASYKGAIL
ncbi:thiamine-phosphate pyrophosphorylase [Jeotgalibacillus malaysiensis]|uniref:Thiamine-phosphate synthase n=1 Tax=Jeotgalibacillus malaysiensis TaxID=1508404 RepID=A0A0B5AK31_9BACL|nr:thiamine phosphate synthase [Jeotgalibacillus malaysiensis]AJD90391.1 thiamine-phosphate pyrophosphorylase [Jeotgalibacillus malaysiensis]